MPSNVSLTGRIYTPSVGPAYFSGSLTDVSTGRSYSVRSIGYAGGFQAGGYDITATLSGGFDALSNGLDIAYANLPFGAGGAKFMDNNGNAIGQGTLTDGPAFTANILSAGVFSFDRPSIKLVSPGDC